MQRTGYMNPHSLNLLHICRQIRSEFGDLYQTKFPVQVGYYDFNAFASTFYNENTKWTLAPRLLRIDLPPHKDTRGLDIIPILLLKDNNPNLEVTFTRNSSSNEPTPKPKFLRTWETLVSNQSSQFLNHVRQGLLSALYIAEQGDGVHAEELFCMAMKDYDSVEETG